MAQTTSELWKTLWRAKNTTKEYGFDINGVWYGPDAEVSHSVDSGLYEEFGIGNATIAQMSISLLADDIPYGATIKRYIRLKNGDQVSEWLPKGIFFANQRPHNGDYWTIEAYDAMRKAEAVWEPDQSLEFPLSMPDAVAEFARIMGVEVDPRISLNAAYTIDYPANEYTIRNELCYIAAAHGGNWIMTDEGKLLLIPLVSIPEETSYLVTERGSAITFGGVRILVGENNATSPSAWTWAEKFFVGMDVTASEDNGKRKPVSRVTLWVDDNNCLTAGDDTGIELESDCPHATQAMVDNILAQVQGYQYQAYSANDANIDPAAELGDGVTVDGMYSVISRISDDGRGYVSLSAPGEKEMQNEFPTSGPMTQEFDRKIAETRATITKTSKEIRLEVANELEGLSASIDIQLDSITADVEGLDGRTASLELGLDGVSLQVTDNTNSIAALDMYIDSLTLSVSNGSTSSTIKLMAGSAEIASQTINMSGLVTYTGLASGTTVINGGCIQTGTIDAKYLNLTGAITFSDLSSSVQADIDDAYSMAYNAQSLANDVDGTVSGWVYPGTTYIDGHMLMTGTVMASELLGGTVGLLTSSERVAGGIDITGSSSSTYAIELYSEGALRLTAPGNVFIQSETIGPYVQLADHITLGEGNVYSNRDGYYYLGTASNRWDAVYAVTGTIQQSDRNRKYDIELLPDKYLQMLLELPVYRFKMEGGTSGRDHVGYVAQDIEEYMEKHNIDSLEFAGFVKDVDGDGNTIYMLRYDEFIAIHTLAIQRIYQKLEAAGL